MTSEYLFKLLIQKLYHCNGTHFIKGEPEYVYSLTSSVTLKIIEFLVEAIMTNLFNTTKQEVFKNAKNMICYQLHLLTMNIKFIDLNARCLNIDTVKIKVSTRERSKSEIV